jgi:hypothetical protein
MMLEDILKICGAVTAFAAVIVICRKLSHWWRPGAAEISYKLVLDGSGPDTISVNVTNKSSSTIYVRSCTVRSTYTMRQLIWRHVRHPFLSPRLYPNLRYNGAVYQFIREEPAKLDPAQLKEFKIDIYEHPLNAIYGPMLIAKVELTTGQIINSKRVISPALWRKIGERGR